MNKQANSAILAISMLIATIAILTMPTVNATDTPTFIVSPTPQNSWYSSTGCPTSVNITVANVTSGAGFQFGMFWENTYLNCDNVQTYIPNGWNNDSTLQITAGIDNIFNDTYGYYLFAIFDATDNPYNVTYTIATMTFPQLLNTTGTTPLSFSDIDIADLDGNSIPSASTDGSINMYPNAILVNVTADGSTIQNFPYPTDWTNWNCSKANDGDTSYVASNEEDQNSYNDLYVANCSWIPQNATSVTVSVHMIIRSTSNLHKAIVATILKATSTGTVYGGNTNPSLAYQDISTTFNITASDGSALQIGAHIMSGKHQSGGIWYYYPGRCTEVYAIVSWS